MVGFFPVATVAPDQKTCVLGEYLGSEMNMEARQRDMMEDPSTVAQHQFTFDCTYGPDSTQEQVYEQTAMPAVMSVLQGYNATIFAYG